jgi:prepilin signal peptidase PulO-like enzyme (type II secretory pathway)
MPPFVFNLILFVLGAVTGAFANWAIYNLCYDERGPISPWSSPGEKASKRNWLDYVPIIGWFFLRRDDTYHGTLHWVRPLAIELSLAAGAVWFYHWQMSGGLIAGQSVVNPFTPENYEIWFSGHALLIVLMVIATFIDFDEKTIPDWITIPGTVMALLFAAFWPEFRLPEVGNNPAGAGQVAKWITFHSNSSTPFPTWHQDWRGFALVVSTLGIWAFALLDTTPFFFRFMWKAFRKSPSRFICLTIAFMLQPQRKTECKIRKSNRRSLIPKILLMGGIFVGLCLLSAYIFILPPTRWDAYFGAVMGLGFGGAMVWLVRIVGGYAMDQEAMGFGDVTLMAMIGAFLGWQAALLTFALAPFAAMLIAVAQLILTRRNDIAFGPYLCLSALFLLLFWNPAWDKVRFSIFGWGITLFYALLGGLVAFGLMLAAIHAFKVRYIYDDESEG